MFLCSGLTLADALWHHCHANEAEPLGDQWFIRNMLARTRQYCPLTPAYQESVRVIHSPKVNICADVNGVIRVVAVVITAR